MRSAKKSVERFQESWDYASQNQHKRWERNWKLYNNERVYVSYQGITNTFVPMTFSTVETLTAALCAGRPSIDFVPQDMYKYIATYFAKGKKPDLEALNAYFDYFWECDNWDAKSVKTVRGGFIYGTSCEWVYWDNDKPRLINLNVRDAIIDPSLTDPMQLITNPDDYYSGRRYFTTIDALKAEQVIDPKTGEMKPRFKNLDKVKTGFSSGDTTDKQFKDMDLGSLQTKDEVEVIEIWTGDSIQSVANRTVNIESRDNDLGIHCLVINRFIADESVIYGKAIVDVIAKPQELLNDVTNQRVDVVTDVMNPQAELDPLYQGWLDKVSTEPATVYPFKPGSLRYIAKPPVPADAFTETISLQNVIREATAADQIVQGVAATGGKPTATEINAQLNQAGERFGLYQQMLEREGFYQRAKIVYRMMLHYIKDIQLVPVKSMDGPKFRTYDPNQYDDSYEPQIRLDSTVKSNKAQISQAATQAFSEIIQDPTNNLWQAKKIMYPKMFDLDEEELDKIIGAQEPQAPAGPAAPADLAPGMPGAAPADLTAPVQPEVNPAGPIA